MLTCLYPSMADSNPMIIANDEDRLSATELVCTNPRTQKLRSQKNLPQHYLIELQLVTCTGIALWTGVEAAAGSAGAAAGAGVKSRFTPRMTRKPNTQNRAPLICLSGQPALRVRLAASSKRDGNEWAWVVNVCSNSRGCVGGSGSGSKNGSGSSSGSSNGSSSGRNLAHQGDSKQHA